MVFFFFLEHSHAHLFITDDSFGKTVVEFNSCDRKQGFINPKILLSGALQRKVFSISILKHSY